MDRNLLARATEGTDAPTPGYLYMDLAKAASANPNVSQEMAIYLTRRLASKQNPNIKYKCCKVIAKLCEQVARNQFRRAMSQTPEAVAAVKEAMNYRGQIDPVQGDAKNERVRQAAKEALDAIYSESAESSVPMGGYSSASYGAPPHAAASGGYPGMGGAPSGPRMEGIGNPQYRDPRTMPGSPGGENFRGALKEAGEVVMGMIKDPLARNVEVPANVPRQGSAELPGYRNNNYGRPPPGQSELSRQTGGQWTMASNRGPGAIQHQANQDYYKSRDTGYNWAKNSAAPASSGGVGGSWANAGSSGQPFSNPSITINHNGPPSGGGGYAVSDGSYERNMILELCPPGGMKPTPPPEKLASFSRSVASLNPDLVCPVLLDCVEDGQPWIIRAKALCVMEVAIQNGEVSPGNNPYLSFFHACSEEIVPLASHPRSAIKDPAKRVLSLMGIDAGSGDAPSPPPASQEAPNLLDFDDAPAPAQAPPSVPPPPPPGTPPAPPSGGASLFGGMQVKGKAPSGADSVVSAASAPAPAPATASVFDFMAESPAPSANGDVASTTSSMFGNLKIKADSADKVEEEKKSASPSGSAFGFINASTAQQAPVSPSKESFDPIKNPSPSNQKKVMQMSQEQMQAMAYQQMMMQRQMQAMAMANMNPQQRILMQQQMMVQMQQQGMVYNQGMQMNNPAMKGFTFKDTRPAKKDDHQFDFVKDAMKPHK